MKFGIEQARRLSERVLLQSGFAEDDAKLITKNLIDAELSGKKSHGLIRLPAITDGVKKGVLKNSIEPIDILIDDERRLLIDAKHKFAYIPLYKSLDVAIKKAKTNGICMVGIKNIEYSTGFVGSYARIAAESDLIFIGFSNSRSVLVPYGAKKALWGTNPITIAVPSEGLPVILDMASTKITWGDLMLAKDKKQKIEKNVAIDADGRITTNPSKAMIGGLLPIAGHKGSGLAFMVEILAGVLTGAGVGSIDGNYGTTYILIDPKMFRKLSDFKKDMNRAILDLKSTPKIKNKEEIYFPGEKSQKLRKRQLDDGEIEIGNELLIDLKHRANL